jgi:3D-(3,5/4)-trihydroxycyclohexane-1,2-dione acylhydrolase (decyclizing)
MAQALVGFLAAQHVERDGRRQPFFAGCFGIFGHGNVAGLGEALLADGRLPYYLSRNEQAMVHAAAGFARMRNRLATLACTSSIGPGATNMLTGAAGATINRLPVLLLPGDIFARRQVAPVLQQLEWPGSQEVSVNDCFRPVSRYWDRISRPEQLLTALPEAMRVLTSPADTGAVTLCLPQDVQAEAFDCPEEFLEERTWRVPRARPDRAALAAAVRLLQASRRPFLVAGGGVLYSEAWEALRRFVERHGLPVGETQAGKGSLPWDHPLNAGALGVTGGLAANRLARDCDLILGIGTRYSDFTTASKTAFQVAGVAFINVNVAEFDAHKQAGLALTGDARAVLEELDEALGDWAVPAEYRQEAVGLAAQWHQRMRDLVQPANPGRLSQAEVIGAVAAACQPGDVVVGAAGSLPGDLHKLWPVREPRTYHLEYGYSCMGYEIAGGLGVKMADPGREVFVMVGDGSYLMLAQEIVTSVAEGLKLNVVLLDNGGFASIGGLSQAVGCGGFGTRYRYRNPATGHLDGEPLPVDLAANARSLGAHVLEVGDRQDLAAALAQARRQTRTTVVVVAVDGEARVPSFESWWDVPVAEVSALEPAREARLRYERERARQRYFLRPPG